MSTKPFVLYDLLGNFTPDKAWSPNVWKIRFILNHKRLPYTTEWVEFADIDSVAQRIGAPPTRIRRDGTPIYTLPILYDPVANVHVSNSMDIARYLDRRFPDPAHSFFPSGTDALFAVFQDAWINDAVNVFVPLMLMRVHDGLSPRSAAFFRKSREAMFKNRLEDIAPVAAQPALWAKVQAAFGKFDAYMRESGGLFVMGDRMTYLDVQMAGWLLWIKRVWGPESSEWKAIERWHDGRWGKLMDTFGKLEYTEDNAPVVAKL